MRTRFSQFIVDSDTRQLLRDSTEIHLSPKAFDLLCALLARRPNVVSKEDLLRQVWPDSYVVEANLNVLVGEVRRAIGDTAQTSQFIRTVHGVGYAFCGNAVDPEGATAGKSGKKAARCCLIGNGATFVLSEGDNIIGRDLSCNVWLDDPDVSRRHALIRIDTARRSAVLEDLDSTNGTLLGGSRVRSRTPLSDGDVIRVGAVELRFRDGSDTAQETRRILRKSR
jgi:DNA-binding winged helix-turn-helix (wHTH) protein